MFKKTNEVSQNIRKSALHQYPAPDLSTANLTFIQSQLAKGPTNTQPMVISPQANAFKVSVPAFQALPSSVSRISNGQIVQTDNEIRKPASASATKQFATIQRIDVSVIEKTIEFFSPTDFFELFAHWTS